MIFILTILLVLVGNYFKCDKFREYRFFSVVSINLKYIHRLMNYSFSLYTIYFKKQELAQQLFGLESTSNF